MPCPARGEVGKATGVMASIDEVLASHTDDWMSLAGVVGTAIGLVADEPCIKIYVVQTTEFLRANIPTTVGGFPVHLQETGEIQTL